MASDVSDRIVQAIVRASPSLSPVATPRGGLFSSPVLSPALYPDLKDERGYYVPLPPPPPFKVNGSQLPTLVGESGGRQWSVNVMMGLAPGHSIRPTLTISTYVRLLRSDLLPFPVLPWLVVAPAADGDGQPGAGRTIDFAHHAARSAIAHATLWSGRAPTPASRPPARTALLAEAWDPAALSQLSAVGFFGLYAGWEAHRVADPTLTPGPVLELLADQANFHVRIDPQDPAAIASTVQQFLAFLPEFERGLTGRDATTDPILVISFREPAGSVPDSRPAYLCPRCGQRQILKRARDAATGLTRLQTLGCGVDVFPAYPDQLRAVQRTG